MSKLIEIKDLYYIYPADNNVIFEGASAEFNSGEKVAIIGQLGSGKTTLLKLILGLERPTRGSILILGNDIGSFRRSRLDKMRRNMGVVFEDISLISNLKVIENVALPLQYHTRLAEKSIMERAVFLLKFVGYRGDIWALPGTLPFYTKKIVAIARAMALEPAIMIYDRLLEGLDSLQSVQVLRFVDEFHKQKTQRLSIMVANDEKDVKDFAPARILRIDNRRLIK